MHNQHKKIVEVAALAGTIMLEAHAESYRVEDTVRRILQTSGLSITEVITTTTGLFITLDDSDPDIRAISLIRRIKTRSNQLNKIYKVNNISRQITSKQITIDEAYQKLHVVEESEYSGFNKDLATMILVIGFTLLLGGSYQDILFSAIIGGMVAASRFLRVFLDLNDFIYGVLTTFTTAFVTNLAAYFLPIELSAATIIVAALMPLYPGTAFTNGIRDLLKGDYVSGVARIADAIVIAISLAIGVAAAHVSYLEVLKWLTM